MSTIHQSGFLPWDRNGNRLLLKSQLGKSKPSNFNLPPQTHFYGKKIYQDPQKANQLMYKWKQQQPSQNPNFRKQKDFVQTNRKCIKSLLHTASDFSKYRKSSVEFKKVKEGSNFMPINLPEENFAYGKPLDLQDPIKHVMANTYGEQDKIARDTFYMTQSMKKQKLGDRKLSFHITKNFNLQKEAASKRLLKFNWDKQTPALWKMNKFKNVRPKTSTKNEKYKKQVISRAQSALKN